MSSIVSEIRSDREKGAKRLESEYKAGLMVLARRFCPDETDAEELVNSTFAAVIDNIDSYLEQSAFFAWMSRILVNIHAKRVRRKSNKVEFCCADLPEEKPDDDACSKVFREVDAAILRDAIDRLPKDMKQTLMLHYFMDISVGEVAKILSIPSGTVKWRLHYARQILAAKLGAGIKKKPLAAIAAALLFLAAGAMVVAGVANAVLKSAGAEPQRAEETSAEAAETRAITPNASFVQSNSPSISVPQIPSIFPQQGETTMNIRQTTTAALAAATLSMPFAALASANYGGETAVSLDSTAYVKVMEDAGPLAGRWSLKGITAWNGAEQASFACVSNRPYASATMTAADAARGDMPTGNYVHQVSVFNQWDGLRTRSYRVQIAQPVGGNDIYARILAVTVSQPGVNLMDHPDIREIRTDSSKIEYYCSTSENKADIANFPVTKLRLVRQYGYVESEGDAFISLGHCAGPNTRIEVDMQLTEVKLGTCPFGSWGDGSSNPLFELYMSHSGDEVLKYSWEYSGADGVRKAMNCNVADLNRHVIAFDATTRKYTSGSYTYTFAEQMLDKTSTVPMSVFGRGTLPVATQASHFGGAAKMKVFGVNIYESGTLVKCFVPCISSGIPGLRDLVNNTFVTGIDPSKVKYGGDIMEKDDAHIDLENTINTRENGKSHYLELFYSFRPSTRIELDYALLAQGFTGAPFLFSAYSGSNMEVWAINGHYAYTIAGQQRFADANGVGDIGALRVDTEYGIRRTVAMNSNSVWFVTAGYTNAVQTSSPALTSTGNSKILVGNRSDLGRYLPVRIYGLRLYENDGIAKNYVPIVTNGVPGMINTLDGTVLYPTTDNGNAYKSLVVKAGGEFDGHTAASEKESYLEFPGTQSMDLGYSLTPSSCLEADFSMWDTYKNGSSNQELIRQDNGASGTFLRLAAVGSSTYNDLWWQYSDGNKSTIESYVKNSNERRQYIFDSYHSKTTFKCGEKTLYDATMPETRSSTTGSGTLKLGFSNAYMRLYGLKISESGNEVRNYVPCVTNGVAGLYETYTKAFFPLAGGKVSGKGSNGLDGDFVVVPQPARVAIDGSATLTCFAPSAQSYQWYMDGEKLDGETGDSLTVNWIRQKPHKRTFSVVPVYNVFGEEVNGKPAETTVEFECRGMMLIIE